MFELGQISLDQVSVTFVEMFIFFSLSFKNDSGCFVNPILCFLMQQVMQVFLISKYDIAILLFLSLSILIKGPIFSVYKNF